MLGGRSFVTLVAASMLPISTAMAEDPDLEIVLSDNTGKFAVIQADKPPDDLDPSLGYLAFWSDYSGQRVWLFDRLLFTAKDAGHALLNLNNRFGVDYTTLAALDLVYDQGLDDARRDPPDPTRWNVAARDQA